MSQTGLRLAPEDHAFGPFHRPEPKSARMIGSKDGTKLHVREYGPVDGAPIVLVHGWCCAIEFWNAQINALTGGYRVVAYDQRGHGRSEAGGPPYHPDMLADDLAAVLDATVDVPATLVGHSMGGVTIMAWAAAYPDRVARCANAVLLADTVANVAAEHREAFRQQHRLERMLTKISLTSLPSPPMRLSRTAFRRSALSDAAVPELVDFGQRIIYSCPARTRSGWARAMQVTDVSAGLDALTVPTTFLYGTADALLPDVVADRVVDQLRERGNLDRVVIVPGVGHGANMQAVDEFNAEIVRLRSLGTEDSPKSA